MAPETTEKEEQAAFDNILQAAASYISGGESSSRVLVHAVLAMVSALSLITITANQRASAMQWTH